MNESNAPLANTLEEAEAFARKHIIHTRGIINYRSFNPNLVNLINTTLYEMVRIFSVRLRAVGTEKDLYLFSRLFGYPGIAKDLYEMRVCFDTGGSWARAWNDCIFLKEDLWRDDGRELRKRIKEAGPHHRKCSSLESLIIHEYAHVLDDAHTGTVSNTEIGGLFAGIIKELTGGYSDHKRKENIKVIQGYFGDCIIEGDPVQEMWAEAFACYFEEKSGRTAVKTLMPALYELIDRKINEIAPKKNKI